MNSRFLCLVGTGIVLSTVLAAQTARHGVGLPSEVGRVAMGTSCKAEAQEAFERGAALLHSFWYEEALKAFEQAAKLNPGCGMAYWGQAMTWTHPLWDPPSDSSLARGLEVAKKAKAVGASTSRERGYIDAGLAMYQDYGSVPQEARMRKYSDAMARLYEENPDDKNAAAFYALSLLNIAREGVYDEDLKAAAIIEKEFGKTPDHPGAIHYLIHAYDNPVSAARGLPAADKYAQVAPAVPHALHMPSHIYTRLGLWDKAVASNEAAWATSDRHVAPMRAHCGSRDYHSLQWLLYAYLQEGRYRKAEEALALMQANRAAEKARSAGDDLDYLGATYHLGDMTARYALERQRWDEARAVPDGGSMRHAAGTTWYARGLGAARSIGAYAASGTTDRLAREAVSALESLSGKSGHQGLAEIERLGVLAAVAAAHKKYEEMGSLLTRATEIEAAIQPPGQPCYPAIPVHELAGSLWFEAGRYGEAKRAYAAALKRYPRRGHALYGYARAAARAGDPSVAESAYREFLDLWKQADPDRPELPEAKAYLAKPRTLLPH